MTDPLRVGFVGLGTWGRTVLRALQEQPQDLALVAIAPHRVFDLEHFLDTPHLQGVVIASPLASHAKLVEAALRRRLPVFVEKPLVASVNEAAVLTSLWQEAGSPAFAVNYQQLYNLGLCQHLSRARSAPHLHFSAWNGGPGPVRPDCSAFMDYAVHDLALLNAMWSPEKPQLTRAAQTEDGSSTVLTMQCDAYCWTLTVSNKASEKGHGWRCTDKDGAVIFQHDLRAPQSPSPLHLSLLDWSRVARGLSPPQRWHTPEFSLPILRWVEQVESLICEIRTEERKREGTDLQ